MNVGLLSGDAAAPRAVNRIVESADLLDRARDPDKAVAWRGPADGAAAALRDLTAIAAVLARRGLRATVSVEPVAGGELLAAVRVT